MQEDVTDAGGVRSQVMRLSVLAPLVLAAAVTAFAPSAVAWGQLPSSVERLAGAAPFSCPEAAGKFADRSDVGRFQHCSDGVPHLRSCDSYQHWSQEAQRCEWPHLANSPGAEPPRPWRLP